MPFTHSKNLKCKINEKIVKLVLTTFFLYSHSRRKFS